MNNTTRRGKHFLSSTLMIAGVLFLALLAAAILIMRREPPLQTVPPEPVLTVEVARMTPEDVPVVIVGHGETRPVETVPVTPQVSGKVVYVHERLFVGEVIPAGATLFEIDPRDYEASLAQARAQAAQARSGLLRLRTQYAADRERLNTARRSRDLAFNEYERLKTLFEEESVGALANVERAEMSYNQARDAHDLLLQNVEIYPTRINEAEQGLGAAEAAVALAETMLERTRLVAPFNARIKDKQVEQGQFVGPGAPVLVLANDAILELAVPLDSRDARMGLRFSETTSDAADKSWFGALEQVPCHIFWTEDADGHAWTGRLDRVMAFDETTRTVTVAVRVAGEEASASGAGLPLVDGMFCRVEIPGKIMPQVYRLPRSCVTFENQVYMAVNGRLMPRDVKVLRTQHDQAFISEGLARDELVIMTRLVTPLPNAKIDYDATVIVSSDALSHANVAASEGAES